MNEWMNAVFMEWMDNAFYEMSGRCVWFIFFSLCACCVSVGVRCQLWMRPMCTARWSEVSILYLSHQFALFVWSFTASWLVNNPPDCSQLSERWWPLICLLSVDVVSSSCFIFQWGLVCGFYWFSFFLLGPLLSLIQGGFVSSHLFRETCGSYWPSHLPNWFYPNCPK